MLPSRFAFAISAETAAIASSVEGFGFFVFAILSLILIYLVHCRALAQLCYYNPNFVDLTMPDLTFF